ncbi:MAG: hypothetical protein VX438_06470, partial [Planctomycetota bacterium]|nr:hypothetical protein [Planctomycetota bacterium]
MDHQQAVRICKGVETQLVMGVHDRPFVYSTGCETELFNGDLGLLPDRPLVDGLAFECSTVVAQPASAQRFTSNEDIAGPTGCAGDIPPCPLRNPLAEIEPAWEVNEFRWSETVRKLCDQQSAGFSQIIESLKLNKNKRGEGARIGVIHSHPNQGATTLATCLAHLLADTQSRVLLAELDTENPTLEERANIKLKEGWQRLNEEGASLEEFLVREKQKDLMLLPLKRETNLFSKRRLLLEKFTGISAHLKKEFDYSIIDIGNVNNLMIEKTCHVGFLDGAIIVSDFCGDESVAISIFERLLEAGLSAVVIAENFRNQSRFAA